MNAAFFDMDGTLTEARQIISQNMIDALTKLSNHCDICVVTGSEYSYVKEQLNNIINVDSMEGVLNLFPCNGTQKWDLKGNKIYCKSMSIQIGNDNFEKLCKFLIEEQCAYITNFPNAPLTGNFIVNRGSLLNYCPPGRNCTTEQREDFISIDVQQSIRFCTFVRLNTFLRTHNIKCSAALGGNTSIDIYPIGWDKTYGLNHFKEHHNNIYFVGDSCSPGQNDYELYKNLSVYGNSFKTGSPEETLTIIEKLIYILNKTNIV